VEQPAAAVITSTPENRRSTRELVRSPTPVNPELNEDSSIFVMGGEGEVESGYDTFLHDQGEPATSSTPESSASPWPACALVTAEEQEQEVAMEEEGKEDEEVADENTPPNIQRSTRTRRVQRSCNFCSAFDTKRGKFQ
jgi:hypothetical protein